MSKNNTLRADIISDLRDIATCTLHACTADYLTELADDLGATEGSVASVLENIRDTLEDIKAEGEEIDVIQGLSELVEDYAHCA